MSRARAALRPLAIVLVTILLLTLIGSLIGERWAGGLGLLAVGGIFGYLRGHDRAWRRHDQLLEYQIQRFTAAFVEATSGLTPWLRNEVGRRYSAVLTDLVEEDERSR